MSESLCPHLLTRGEIVGGYEIRQLVGRSHSGEVYLALHPIARQEVALRIYSGAAPVDDGFALCFPEEAEALITLRHPNVMRVLEAGVQNGVPYLVMEYVAGGTLAALLGSHSHGLGREQLRTLFSQIANGVATAHEAGLVHGGLRPDNILVAATGRPVVTECALPSLRQLLPSPAGSNGTRATVYCAPENRDGQPPTTASDIFSLGMLLHVMATGEPPIKALARRSRVNGSAAGHAATSLQINLDLDPSIDRVVLAALCPDPAQRPASVRAMLQEFESDELVPTQGARAANRGLAPALPPSGRMGPPADTHGFTLAADDSVAALVPRRSTPAAAMLAAVALVILFALLVIALL